MLVSHGFDAMVQCGVCGPSFRWCPTYVAVLGCGIEMVCGDLLDDRQHVFFFFFFQSITWYPWFLLSRLLEVPDVEEASTSVEADISKDDVSCIVVRR